MAHNKPLPQVILAYANKVQRLSSELERLARLSKDWMDPETTKKLWQAENIMYHMAAKLKEQGKMNM